MCNSDQIERIHLMHQSQREKQREHIVDNFSDSIEIKTNTYKSASET